MKAKDIPVGVPLAYNTSRRYDYSTRAVVVLSTDFVTSGRNGWQPARANRYSRGNGYYGGTTGIPAVQAQSTNKMPPRFTEEQKAVLLTGEPVTVGKETYRATLINPAGISGENFADFRTRYAAQEKAKRERVDREEQERAAALDRKVALTATLNALGLSVPPPSEYARLGECLRITLTVEQVENLLALGGLVETAVSA